jgi:hypothetical protein
MLSQGLDLITIDMDWQTLLGDSEITSNLHVIIHNTLRPEMHENLLISTYAPACG